MTWNNSIFQVLLVTTGGPGQGLFVYNGPPGRGTLIVAATGQTGLDPTGQNTVPAVLNIGKWDAVTGLLDQHSGFDASGDFFVVGSNVQFQDLVTGLQGAIMVPSGDTTGVQDPAQVGAFFGNGAKEVVMMPGTYYFKAGQVVLGLNQYLRGSGKSATIIKVIDSTPGAAGVAFTNATGVYQPSQFAGIGRLTLDGTGTTAVTHGLIVGDIAGVFLDDVHINHFTGSAATKGLLLFNQHFFTEQLHGTVYVQNCSVGVGLDVTGTGTGSFDRMDLDVWIKANDTQVGVQFLGGATGAFIQGGRLGIWGNFGAGASGTGSVIEFDGAGSAILEAQLDIGVECNSAGTGPSTIKFVGGNGVIQRCYGVMRFIPAPVAFQASNNNQQIDYNGRITGDTALLIKVNHIDLVTVNSGFPAGVTGTISAKKIGESSLVFIDFSLSIASGTAIINGELLASAAFPSPLTNPAANNTVDLWLQGGGLNQAQSVLIDSSGNVTLYGPGFTPAGSTAFLTGSAVYSNSY